MVRSLLLTFLSLCIIALSINAQFARRSVNTNASQVSFHKSQTIQFKNQTIAFDLVQDAQFSSSKRDLSKEIVLIFNKEDEEKTIDTFSDGITFHQILQVNTKNYCQLGNNLALGFYRNKSYASCNSQTQFQVFQI